MSLLWVFYREHVQKIQLSELPPSQPITIGPDMKDTITVGTLPLRQNAATLYRKETDRYDVFLGNNCAGELTIGNEMPCRIEEETMRLLLTPDKEESSVYFIGGKDEIVFSSETEEADIYKEPSSAQTGAFYLRKSGGCWSVVPDGQDVYVNGKLAEAPERLRTGDEPLWNFLRVRLTEDDLLEVVHHESFKPV